MNILFIYKVYRRSSHPLFFLSFARQVDDFSYVTSWWCSSTTSVRHSTGRSESAPHNATIPFACASITLASTRNGRSVCKKRMMRCTRSWTSGFKQTSESRQSSTLCFHPVIYDAYVAPRKEKNGHWTGKVHYGRPGTSRADRKWGRAVASCVCSAALHNDFRT